MHKIIFLISFLLFFGTYITHAQTENKDIIITACGTGNTFEEAKKLALKSSTVQVIRAFMSSKTEIFNDQIEANSMESVSTEYIKSFEIINQDQLPDGRWGVTLKTIFSIDKLTSFVQAKGVTIEFNGGMFALNIKQQLLFEQGEINAVAEMVGILHEPMQISFDYVIKSSDPKSLDAESKNWEIPLMVTANCNKNIDFCANYFFKTLKALSLTSAEVESYKSLNKQVFPLSIQYSGKKDTFFLRKERSINIIKSLLYNWEFYTRLFSVQSGTDETFGKGGIINNLMYVDRYNGNIYLIFPKEGDVVATFTWNDKRTLSQIEKMTGYAVRPRGVVSKFKNGGYLVYEKDGHGLVAAVCDIGRLNWADAKTACEELLLNGYSDWHLPTKDELLFLYSNLHLLWIGRFITSDLYYSKEMYWSSTEGYQNAAWSFSFTRGDYKSESYNKVNQTYYVRPVRLYHVDNHNPIGW